MVPPVTDIGTAVNDVVVQARRMTDLATKLNASTNRQRTGRVKAKLAVAKIGEGPRQSAALVEECAAAA